MESQQDQKLFFKKNGKIDTHLAILTKRKGEKTHITKIKSGDMYFTEITKLQENTLNSGNQ